MKQNQRKLNELNTFIIPQWQIDKVLETKKKVIANPALLISWKM